MSGWRPSVTTQGTSRADCPIPPFFSPTISMALIASGSSEEAQKFEAAVCHSRPSIQIGQASASAERRPARNLDSHGWTDGFVSQPTQKKSRRTPQRAVCAAANIAKAPFERALGLRRACRAAVSWSGSADQQASCLLGVIRSDRAAQPWLTIPGASRHRFIFHHQTQVSCGWPEPGLRPGRKARAIASWF